MSTRAKRTLPKDRGSVDHPDSTPLQISNHGRQFITLALSMSWRLAIVVVGPILIGNALDTKLHSLPWLTLAGLGVAALGIWLVLLGTLARARNESEGSV